MKEIANDRAPRAQRDTSLLSMHIGARINFIAMQAMPHQPLYHCPDRLAAH